MEVRLAVCDDINQLYELNLLFENDATKEQMAAALQKNELEIVCIAIDNGKGLGYCTGNIIYSICHRKPRVEIESLYVRPEYRKAGVGEALIKCLEREAANRLIGHFHLNTGSTNTAAQSFYAKMGFSSSGEVLLEKTISID